MVMKSTNTYKHLRVFYYILYIVCLLHVQATLVAVLREVHYKRYVTKFPEPMHKCEI
jgi:hypothetical protein